MVGCRSLEPEVRVRIPSPYQKPRGINCRVVPEILLHGLPDKAEFEGSIRLRIVRVRQRDRAVARRALVNVRRCRRCIRSRGR